MKRVHILLLALLAVALTACNAPTVTPTPLSSDTPVVLTSFESDGSAGLTALHGNNGLPMWKAKVGHFNWAPVVVNGVVYGVGTETTGPGQRVVAVRASDGKTLWTKPLPQGMEAGRITASASMVVLTNGSDGLYGLDPADGAVRWHVTGRVAPQVVVRKDIVYALMGGEITFPVTNTHISTPDGLTGILVAVYAKNGAERRAARVEAYNFAVTEKAVYLGSYTTTIDARDITTGQRLASGGQVWQSRTVGIVLAASERVVLAQPQGVGHPHLQGLAATDGRLLWESPADLSYTPFSPNGIPLSDEMAYAVDKGTDMVGIKLADGSIAWRARFGRYQVGSSALLHGVIFAWLYPQGSGIRLGPCFSECTSSLAAIDATTGRVYWQRDIENMQSLAIPQEG